MIKTIYKQAIISIQKEEQKISLEAEHVIEEAFHMAAFLRNLLSDMKNHISENGFSNDNEEIEFFKTIKPQILGKLLYYNKVFRIETSSPVMDGKMYFKYFSNELQELKQEFKEHSYNSDFYRYYRSGRTDMDHIFFQLGNIDINFGLNSFVFEIDTKFSTYYDYKVAKIISNELLYNYLLSKTNTDESENLVFLNSKKLHWSDSKNALIELIYALYASRSIANGKVGISQISKTLQSIFNIQLGDIHHAFHRMKDRTGDRTLFLNHLKSSLEEYMDKNL